MRKPGPGIFPFLAGLIIFTHNLLLFFLGGSRKENKPVFMDHEKKTFFLIILTFVSWLVLVPFLGYILMTFGATFSLSKIMKLEGWRNPLFLSIGTSGLCYFLFDFLLYSNLPRGVFP